MIEAKRRIAAIQMATSPNVEANLLEAAKLIAEAVGHGAGLVVLPENFGFMGRKDHELLDIREQAGSGQLQDFLAQQARRHGIWLVGGTVPITATNPERVRAACLVFNPQGEQVGRYDKIHLFDAHIIETDEHYKESDTIEPGNALTVVDTPFGRLGLAVCYDLRFPELFRKLVEMGAEIIALPSAFTAITGRAHWEVLVRARAIENLSYLIAAGQGGYHKSGRETYGHSMIINPWGLILGQMERGSGAVVADLDHDYQRNIRRTFPCLSHRHLRCSLD